MKSNTFTYFDDYSTEVDFKYELEGKLSDFEKFFNEVGVKYTISYYGLDEERSFSEDDMNYIFPVRHGDEDLLIVDLGDKQYNFYCRQLTPINFHIKLSKTNEKKCNSQPYLPR